MTNMFAMIEPHGGVTCAQAIIKMPMMMLAMEARLQAKPVDGGRGRETSCGRC
jgi:hypothetical protein